MMAEVVISPATTTNPVVTRVSQATRPLGSWRITSSSTASEIWSAILSGWPSVTDSEVNKKLRNPSLKTGSPFSKLQNLDAQRQPQFAGGHSPRQAFSCHLLVFSKLPSQPARSNELNRTAVW